jgi:uncharacterized repeat protein (TIGR03803 family)
MRAVGTALLLGISLTARTQGFTPLHNFSNTPDGANPGQLAWANGFFYGPTANGGSGSSGSIYRFNPSGSVFTTIYNFTGATDNGNTPNALLVTGSMIYGTTKLGGTSSVGMIFEVNTNGTGFTSLYSFGTPPDGYYPEARLVLSDSTLYGTTYTDGTNHGGTIFKINTNGSGYATLHWFTNSPDGYSPQSELVASGSTLFGTTAFGGSNGYGIIFSIATNGTNYTILHSFTNTPDGRYPYGGLVLDSGFLYGTTGSGGSNNNGTVFAISTNGSGYKVLHHFTSQLANTDGSLPKGTSTLNAGILYGTASGGGSGNGGTLFQLNTNGTGFAVIRNFTFNPGDGNVLENGVVLLGSTLWGTTYSGGTAGYGMLYSLPLAPAISQQPTDLTVLNGSPASFTNVASGAAPLFYQWYLNTNTPVNGGTNAVLSIPSATTLQAGYYSVVVTNNYGSITSSAARLIVNVTATAPSITQQPLNLTVTNGNPASFTAAASGTSPLFYQWYFNTNTPVSGGTGATLNIASATTNQAGYYSVIVTNIAGSATSSAAKLTVNVSVSASAPSITQQPLNLTVTNGNPASFTAAASGTAPLFYQWYFNTNTPVSGGTSATLNIASATTNQAGYYSVIVTNAAGSATSFAARLTVVVPTTGPIITQQPQDYTVTNGYDAFFTNVASGTAPLFYQWYFNTNTPIEDGTNSVLLVSFVATNQAGYYSVIVSNLGGSATSSPAKLTVISTRPIIISDPGDQAANNGDTFNFTVLAAGQSQLKYQWYFSRSPNLLGTAVAGQTGSSYSNTAITSRNGNYYTVVVTNTLGKATSSPALLTVITTPVITTNPEPQTVNAGATATFSVTALGANLSFQWYSNSVNTAIGTLLAGQTNGTCSFTAATNQNGRYYSVVVTNTFGRATSSPPALLTVQLAAGQPKFLSFSFDPVSSSFSFTVSNSASSANRLWASTNLTSDNFWGVIASNTMAANGLWLFTDPNIARTNQARFYRASAP